MMDGNLAINWTHNPRCGEPTNAASISYSCTLTTTVVGEDLNYSVYFNELVPGATQTTTAVTTMEAAFLDLVDNSVSTIDIALYGLNRQSIVAALISAHNRGVIVRVVGDDGAATNAYSDFYSQLTAAGIPLVTDTSQSAIQHNKFMIVDGEIVWTGSTNFTDTGFTLNANNSIVITSTTLATVYASEFNEMVSGVFQGSKADNTAHLLDYNGTLVELYFSPSDIVAFEVWNELQEADESLHFAMFFWTDSLLSEIVAMQIPAGLEVIGVWDLLGAASVSSQDEMLCAAGARIGIEPFAGKLHHKFGVIDVASSDPRVITGSYNWTASGAYSNDENTLIIHDAVLAQAYAAETERLWAGIALEDICK